MNSEFLRKLEKYTEKLDHPYVELKLNIVPRFDHGLYTGESFHGITYRVNPRDRVFWDSEFKSENIEIPYNGDEEDFKCNALIKLKELYKSFNKDTSEIESEFKRLAKDLRKD